MLSSAENKMFSQVGPGTPAGNWLRRYWLPIAISDKWNGIKTLWKCDEQFTFKGRMGTVSEFGKQLGTFTGQPTAVRILGEDLVLFRDGAGRLGLLGLHCPHRATSLEYGRIRQDGLECCYHGWRFDVEGNCIDQPAEPPEKVFKDKVKHLAYSVQETGGLIWAYLGPGQAPILPKIDVVAREDGVRAVENYGLWPCNYFQAIENSPDTTHTGILHGGQGERSDIWGREIPKPSWEENDLGIMTKSVRSTTTRTSQYLLPTTLRLTQPWPSYKLKWPRYSAIWKVPVDDYHTLHFSVVFTPYINGKAPELPQGLTFDITDELAVHRLQDYQAIISQGQIYDRTMERIGSSDGGIILLRKIIREAIEAVQRGEDPKGVSRTADANKILDFSDASTDSTFSKSAVA
jgi:5,5'-dehydrodivanillate O-demethylase oxygenase subunit